MLRRLLCFLKNNLVSTVPPGGGDTQVTDSSPVAVKGLVHLCGDHPSELPDLQAPFKLVQQVLLGIILQLNVLDFIFNMTPRDSDTLSMVD